MPEAPVAADDLLKREAVADVEVEIIDNVRGPDAGPIEPVRLSAGDSVRFSCHKGVSCWNVCCHDTDITLTPCDILRLSRHLKIRPSEFLAKFAVPAIWDKTDLPVAKLRVSDEAGERKPCVFLHDQDGCTVYEDRPAACRYYPLGLAAVKMKGHERPEDFHFLVKEPDCKGHHEAKEQTVADFRREQGAEPYDELNRGWIDILMKMTSWKTLGGPQGRDLDPRTKKMFFMATTDPDAFRRFVFETRFLETYEIDNDIVEHLKSDDELLLRLACDWLENVIFNEPTVTMRERALQRGIAMAQRDMGAG